MKKKIKVNYSKFPTFEEFVNKKEIEHCYDFCGVQLRRKIYIQGYKIILKYEALVRRGMNYYYEPANEKDFELTSYGYLKMQMYVHRYEFVEQSDFISTNSKFEQETIKLFNEYQTKIKALEVKNNE